MGRNQEGQSRGSVRNGASLAIENTSDLPDVSEGYQIWKEAFDKGEGGIFTIPVSKIIQYIEDIVTRKADNK